MQSKLERLYEVADRAVEIARACNRPSCECKQRAIDAQKAVEVEKSTLDLSSEIC